MIHLLTDLESVIKAAQSWEFTLGGARVLLHGILEKYLSIGAHLELQNNLIENFAYETAIENVRNDEEVTFTVAEQKSLQHLLLPAAETCSDMSENEIQSFADRLLKRRRVNRIKTPSNYFDLHFIVPTSNQFERLFSVAKYELGSRKAGVQSFNIEFQLLLHINASLWNIVDVHKMLQK